MPAQCDLPVIFGEQAARPARDSVAIDFATRAFAMHTAAAASQSFLQTSMPMSMSMPLQTASLPSCPSEAPGWSALIAERAQLVRFARRRLLDPCLAEDLVHDVFEAVMTGRARFDGRASLRTWLTAILKHKIVDLVRARSGIESLDQEGSGGSDDSAEESAIAKLECPQPRPDEVATQRELLRHTLERIRALPQTLRLAFERRVLADEDSASVCAALGISENNLFVRLHRARALIAA